MRMAGLSGLRHEVLTKGVEEVKHGSEMMYQLEPMGLQEMFDKVKVKYVVELLVRVGEIRLRVSRGL